jgi:hypothetical protein
MPTLCSCFALLAPGRRVRCIVPDPAHDPTAHLGAIRITLPDGRERVATLLWSDAGRDDDNTDHAD